MLQELFIYLFVQGGAAPTEEIRYALLQPAREPCGSVLRVGTLGLKFYPIWNRKSASPTSQGQWRAYIRAQSCSCLCPEQFLICLHSAPGAVVPLYLSIACLSSPPLQAGCVK